MNLNYQHQKWLLTLLGFNIVSTFFHYTDNAYFLDRYPGPTWLTPAEIVATWLFMTLIGLVGYWMYRQKKFWSAYLCLGLYSITSVSSPGHYLYPIAVAMSAKMHALIWSDAIAGFSLIGFILWSALVLREWRQENIV